MEIIFKLSVNFNKNLFIYIIIILILFSYVKKIKKNKFLKILFFLDKKISMNFFQFVEQLTN